MIFLDVRRTLNVLWTVIKLVQDIYTVFIRYRYAIPSPDEHFVHVVMFTRQKLFPLIQ